MSKAQCNLKMGHLNVRSLLTNFDHLLNQINFNKFDLFAVTETWLNVNIPTALVAIPGYKFFRFDRDGRGGGVGVFVRDQLRCEPVLEEFQRIDGVEYMLLELLVGKFRLLICVLYRVPSGNLKLCIDHMDDLLSYITPLYNDIMLLGDVNVDHAFDNIFAECMTSYNFSQIVSEPTRITQTTEKLIDVIYVNNTDIINHVGTINSDLISDHRTVFCELSLLVGRPEPQVITYRDFKYFSQERFLIDLNAIHWDLIFYMNDIEEKILFLNANILNIFDKHAPYRTSRITKRYTPWITNTIEQMMKDRDKALSRFKRSKNANDYALYKSLRNMVVSAIRREKGAYLQHVQGEGSARQLWKALGNLSIKPPKNNELPYNLRDTEGINQYFASVFSGPNNCPETTEYFMTHKANVDYSFGLELATLEQIKSVVVGLTSNAQGTDQVSAQILKHCTPVILKHITHIVNCCLELGYFPSCWKTSLIRPLPKVNNPANYGDLRPVSVLPALSKVLEKIVYGQLYTYVVQNSILNSHQSGFRKQHSTTTVLVDIVDDIFGATDDGDASLLVLLDFSKAFDTLDHSLLCAKLRYYGLDDTSLKFFVSYLGGRFQRTLVGDTGSGLARVTSGVPQGSILGPLLFLVYTADIFSSVSFSKLRSFADDTQMTYSFNPGSIEQANRDVNSDLRAIEQYANNNNLKLNKDKCSLLIFCSKSRRQDIENNIHLFVNGKRLQHEYKAKNLGVIFDIKLRFTDHVSTVISKCYAALKPLYKNINIINFKLRKKLCETLIFPRINYANIVYFPCLDKITYNRLQRMLNTCCRFVCRLRKFDHISQSYKQLKWLKIDGLYKYYLSVSLHKILSTSSPSYLRDKLQHRMNIHDVNLRYAHKLAMPRYHTTAFRSSFSYNAPFTYNQIKDETKNLPLNSFCKALKKHLLQ